MNLLVIIFIMLFMTACNKQEEQKTSIVNKTYNLGNIQFKVPDFWFANEEEDNVTFYPDEGENEVFLLVHYYETGLKDPTEEDYNTFIDAFFRSMVDGDEWKLPRVNDKEIKKNGDFYIGTASIKVEYEDAYREFLMYNTYDTKTGISYTFGFTSPENVSQENKNIFNEITNSISLR